MKARLAEKLQKEVLPAVQEKFGVKNIMAVPRLQKIVVNMGVGEAVADINILETAVKDLTAITGQKPIVRKARKAISNFKLRENAPVGCKVTLRGDKMYEFLDRLVNIALPRIRDFNGVSRKSFDKGGNYTLGLSEQTIFPEIPTDQIPRPQGMDISFVFNHGPEEQTFEILSLLGMPFRKR
ncbi:MAG TPA: 50S ribosomal protein L5 [Candidatus Omnitrophota bacterium]|nr:50S ribosomal protein L5 [Candidatus Omnitrophota bacterium]